MNANPPRAIALGLVKFGLVFTTPPPHPPSCPGARLTAFELAHDQLPATLICDSAAAALMAAGQVDAVVVGADR